VLVSAIASCPTHLQTVFKQFKKVEYNLNDKSRNNSTVGRQVADRARRTLGVYLEPGEAVEAVFGPSGVVDASDALAVTESREFLMAALMDQWAIFPMVVGTCGSLFAFEKVWK